VTDPQPLSAAERAEYQSIYSTHSCDRPVCSTVVITRYEATVRALEAERDDYADRLGNIRRQRDQARREATHWERRAKQLAALTAAARAYADRWENGTDTEMLQARTALLDAVAALPAASGLADTDVPGEQQDQEQDDQDPQGTPPHVTRAGGVRRSGAGVPPPEDQE